MNDELSAEEKIAIDNIVVSVVNEFKGCSKLNINEIDAIVNASEYVAQAFKNQRDKNQIIKQLTLKGLSVNNAKQFVNAIDIAYQRFIDKPEGKMLLRNKYKKKMVFGFFLILIGIVLTFLFYDKTEDKKLRGFMVGSIIVGLIEAGQGIFRYLKYR